jgi:hypothetical protein
MKVRVPLLTLGCLLAAGSAGAQANARNCDMNAGVGGNRVQGVYPNAPYDGKFIFARIAYGTSMGGRFGRGEPPWHHDYNEAETHFTKLLVNLTKVKAHTTKSSVFTLDDPGLTDNAGRSQRRDELDQVIGEWTGRNAVAYVLKALAEAQVPSGKIYSIADIVADPQYLARDMIRQATLPDGTTLRVPGVVPKLSDTPGDLEWVGPKLGEHTAEVLARIGYSEAEIAALRDRKAI